MKTEQTYTKGMILTSTWGYGQTNVSWYKVVKVSKSGKSLTLQQYDSTEKAIEDRDMLDLLLLIQIRKGEASSGK